MSSLFKKIFGQLGGSGSGLEHSSLLPQNVDKLRSEFSAEEELDGPGGSLSAREAFNLAEEIILAFDEDARLTHLESKGALDPSGRAEGWSFRFLLPNRWGHARFTFHNLPGEERVVLALSPFAAEGSALDKMLQEGQAGFVEQQWKVEMERQPSLSHGFQDSSVVIETWINQGKKVELSGTVVLRAITPPLGKARWELLDRPGSKKSLYTLLIE